MSSNRSLLYIGGELFGRTPPPCYHQYEIVYHDKKNNIKIYQCYWCLNQLIKYGGVSDRSADQSKTPPRGNKNERGAKWT